MFYLLRGKALCTLGFFAHFFILLYIFLSHTCLLFVIVFHMVHITCLLSAFRKKRFEANQNS